MEKNQDKKTIYKKLLNKYRLSIYRDDTYEEVLNMILSRLNVLAWGGLIMFVFLFIVVSIIVYTPVREFIPGYPDENTRKSIISNKLLLDSLAYELKLKDKYFENLNRIISGKEPENYDNQSDTNREYKNIKFTRSIEDSLMRESFKQEDQFSVYENQDDNKPAGGLSQIRFFPPIKGLVTNSFNSVSNHYGTDVVAGSNEVVKSTLDGTVIMATWTLETGWVIQVQHTNNLISIYKHNAELLKRVGDFVKVGEPIAIIGNSGELTTGPHLHFELWYNGIPLNPEDYISF
jgi:murein DD-endopeptidase MepM/ murein hydrolase activator NlpD